MDDLRENDPCAAAGSTNTAMTLHLAENADNARDVMNTLAQAAFDLQAAGFGPDRVAIVCQHQQQREKGMHVCKFHEFTTILCVPCMTALEIAHADKLRNAAVPRGTSG